MFLLSYLGLTGCLANCFKNGSLWQCGALTYLADASSLIFIARVIRAITLRMKPWIDGGQSCEGRMWDPSTCSGPGALTSCRGNLVRQRTQVSFGTPSSSSSTRVPGSETTKCPPGNSHLRLALHQPFWTIASAAIISPFYTAGNQ